MIKAVLWECPERESKVLIPEHDVSLYADLGGESVYLFPEIELTAEHEQWLEDELLPRLRACKPHDIWDMLAELGVMTGIASELEERKSILGYFCGSKSIGNLEDCEAVRAYEYYDGHNWVKLQFTEDMTETVIEYDNERGEDLDKYDDSNWYYKHKFNHAALYPIISIDGENVEDQHLTLRKEWSQYQGVLPTGTICKEGELP